MNTATLHDNEQHKNNKKTVIYVDYEPVETEKRELEVREILVLSGNEPAENFYLIEYKGKHEKAKHDNLGEVIKIHEGMRFAAVYCGVMPHS
jgi:hypothetical protein